jgi:uncharacterized protein (UPF0548 family)
MMLYRKPTPEFIADYIRRQHGAPLSYDFATLTQSLPHAKTPPGFVLDHRREQIGSGSADWERAKEAIEQWVMFRNGWTDLHAPDGLPRVDNIVGMLTQMGGLWWLNLCRVLYEIDETKPMKRFGFGYGTLFSHVERGEERFMVEQDAEGNIWYDLTAFSRPRDPFARLLYPLTRRVQLKFGADSMQAMRGFIRDNPIAPAPAAGV